MRQDRKIYAAMYERIPKVIAGKDVLEIATGPGLLAKHVAYAAHRMIATDYSEGMTKEARKGTYPDKLTFEVADAANLPFADKSFDVVLIANALHVMPDPEKALEEIGRVLKDRGILIAPNFVNHKSGLASRIWSGILRLGGWDTNCFDGRLCEEEYTEKIIDFINYMTHFESNEYTLPKPVPQWIYLSNHDEIDHYRIFWGGEKAAEYISALQEWGKLFDHLLHSKNDYLLFDYLVNTIYKDNEYNENHLMKAFSLCQLFLEKDKEIELDWKLPQLFEAAEPKADARRRAELFRKMRNKIAHGDFLAFETMIEMYAAELMDGQFAFDYSECSRKNWAVQHVCCELDDVVRKLLCMLLFDREKLEKIKNSSVAAL